MMPDLTVGDLIEKAKTVLSPRELYLGNRAGDVACALQSVAGNIYLGVCMDIAAMITAGETAIARVVAISGDGKILPPCGRCRELMYEIDASNLEATLVIVGQKKAILLKELLPHPYHEVWNE
jgi:cytidine deaminase